MKSLIMYDEFGPGMGFKSMKESFSKEPYYGKDKILNYLKNGEKTYARAACAKDIFTGAPIGGEYVGMTDGEYTWNSILIYYVETYNLHLIKDFEEKVIHMQN